MNKHELIRLLLLLWDKCIGINVGKTIFNISEVMAPNETTYWTFSHAPDYLKFDSYEEAQRCMIDVLISTIDVSTTEQLSVPAYERAYMNPSIETIYKIKNDLTALLKEAGYDLH